MEFTEAVYGFFEQNYSPSDNGANVNEKLRDCIAQSDEVMWPGSCNDCETTYLKFLSYNLLNFKMNGFNEELAVGSVATIREITLFRRRARR